MFWLGAAWQLCSMFPGSKKREEKEENAGLVKIGFTHLCLPSQVKVHTQHTPTPPFDQGCPNHNHIHNYQKALFV